MTRPTTTRRPAARGSSSPAPGAKTARGRATQAALVRAAQTVFERDGFLDARIADVTAHHRAYLETYHRNAKMMRVVEEVTNVSDSFRRERTARAQTWIEASREAVGKLQREGRADPDLDPLTTARALSLMLSRSAYVTFVLEEEGAESIEGLARTLTRLWVNALRIPLDA